MCVKKCVNPERWGRQVILTTFNDHTKLSRLWADKGFAPPHPRRNFVDYVFHKAYHLMSFLKHVSILAAVAFGCYSVLITLYPLKNMQLRLLRKYLNK